MEENSRLLTRNQILNVISDKALERLGPSLEKVDLPLGKVLYAPDEPIRYVYFPEEAMVSVVAYTEEGRAAEVAVIGGEGATGLAVVLGVDSTPYENIIQLPNGGLRIKTERIQEEFDRKGSLHDALLRFTQSMIVQISQTALCNRLHSVEQRMSRWLLMCRDRAASDSLGITQEFLAVMLGSNRTSVTITAIEIQKRGMISYRRGRIQILDRAALEKFTCSCYQTILSAYSSK